MRKLSFVVLFASVLLRSQETSATQKLNDLTDELERAVNAGDWKRGAELSKALADAATWARDSSLATSTGEQVNQILRWLPEDTETLLVAAAPFTLAEPDKNGPPKPGEMAHNFVGLLLAAPGEGKLAKKLEGRTLRYAVLGARQFGFHADDGSQAMPLGLIAFQGCAVYGFEKPVGEAMIHSDSGIVVQEHPVWMMEGKLYDQARDARPTTDMQYLTLLKPDVLLACNNKDFLTTMLTRMKRTAERSALPDSLPEWQHVDRAAPFWGLRHLLPGRQNVDPSLHMGFEDPTLVGLTIQVEANGKPRVQWLSSAEKNPWEQAADSPDFQGIVARKTGRNVWELSADANSQGGTMLVYAAMAIMGLVVVV
jgi:hypothetical protein